MGSVTAVTLAGLALAACSPTYGTDKTANAQLVDDVSSILSLGPRQRPVIEYQPRPELVRPATTTVLPPPQDDASRNASWPESPEQRLGRIRREASSEEGLTTPVIRDGTGRRQISASASEATGGSDGVSQRQEFQRRLAEQRQGSPTVRRTLSEPPVQYRQPADTAPQGELGEAEWRKERDARRAAGERRGIRDMLPW